jgi:hypothetical protein
MSVNIEAITETPSFLFLWVGSAEGLTAGRALLKKWGFRRCEDICWIKTNKKSDATATATATASSRDDRMVFQQTKEHCLMGIRGTVRRNQDSHIIHCNIDTDVIISEEPPAGSMYASAIDASNSIAVVLHQSQQLTQYYWCSGGCCANQVCKSQKSCTTSSSTSHLVEGA